MSKLKSFQEKVQSNIVKAIDSTEEQYKNATDKSFEYAEKLEEKGKSYTIGTVKAKHYEAVAKLADNARELNEKADKFVSELIEKIEEQTDKAVKAVNEQIEKIKGTKKTAKKPAKKPAAKKAAAKPAAKKAAAKPAAKKATPKAEAPKKEEAATA